MFSKQGFLNEYRRRILEAYGTGTAEPWAADTDRLNRFMASVERTLKTPANTWNKDSDVARATWKAIGGKGTMTYKALKALPD